ncbi:MAG: outer membrane lipoprotein-sorting protein [Candidatus Rifleibacteriota bacterium]
MKIRYLVAVMFIAFCFYADSVQAMTAQELLEKVEDRYIGKTSRADSLMILKSDNGPTRKRKMGVFRKKEDNVNRDNFIHFFSPADIRNTTYLVNERNHRKKKWIYLSAFRKRRRIVGKDYGVAFVSSDFTYEDMDPIHADDYVASDLKEEKLGDTDVYSIVIKKKDDETSYDRVVLKIDKEKLVILKSLMYDKNNPEKLVKVMTAEDLEKIQDIWTPKKVTMKDLEGGTETTLETVRIKYDLELPANTFTTRNMEK